MFMWFLRYFYDKDISDTKLADFSYFVYYPFANESVENMQMSYMGVYNEDGVMTTDINLCRFCYCGI